MLLEVKLKELKSFLMRDISILSRRCVWLGGGVAESDRRIS